MRTFHTGGVAGDDITQGLPHIQEIFEARNPKGQAVISEIDGVIAAINDVKDRQEVVVQGEVEARTYAIPYGARLKVIPGQKISHGKELTEGSIDPKRITKSNGHYGSSRILIT